MFVLTQGYYSYPSFFEHMSISKKYLDGFDKYLATDFVSIMTFTICIPFFEFLVYPFFRNYIPRTTVRIGLGMFVVLIGLSSLLTLDAVAHSVAEEKAANICMFYAETPSLSLSSWYIIPVIVIMTIGELLVILPILEFVCAQAPYSMRGLVIGIVFMVYGVYVGLLSILLAVFSTAMKDGRYRHVLAPGCGTWYLLTVILIGCVGTMLYIIAAKRYKKRQRGGQVDINQQTVVEDHHERYISSAVIINLATLLIGAMHATWLLNYSLNDLGEK